MCAYLEVDWRFRASLCQLYHCRREEILSQNKLTTWREAVFKGQILFALFFFSTSSSIIYSRWSSQLFDHQTDVYFLTKCEMKTTIGGIAIDIFFLREPTATA